VGVYVKWGQSSYLPKVHCGTGVVGDLLCGMKLEFAHSPGLFPEVMCIAIAKVDLSGFAFHWDLRHRLGD